MWYLKYVFSNASSKLGGWIADLGPFILLFPLGSINTTAFLSAFGNEIENVSIIIPNGRIKYIVNGSVQKSPSFESCYLCYRMRIDKLVFLKWVEGSVCFF